MTALLIVLGASLATWLLRIGFITVLPAERLPARVQRAFDDVAPAVLAAIVVSHVVRRVRTVAGGDAAHLLDVCAIDTDGKSITGVVSPEHGDRVAAVSPRWG
jgi:uncharacterized membrane protein